MSLITTGVLIIALAGWLICAGKLKDARKEVCSLRVSLRDASKRAVSNLENNLYLLNNKNKKLESDLSKWVSMYRQLQSELKKYKR